MFDYLQNILLIIFEIVCCKIFYEIFGEKRTKIWGNIIQVAVLTGSSCLIVYFFANNFIIRQIAMILALSIFMFWYIKISFYKSVTLAILFHGLLLATDYFAFSINSKLFHNNDVIKEYYYIEGVLVVLLGKVILFLCILIIKKQFGKKTTDMLADTEWIRFLFFPIFTIAVIASMLSVFNNIQTPEQANVLFIIAFGVAGMNIVVFYFINDIIERKMELHKNRVFQMQVKNQVDMYRSISENFDNQKRKTHEYKNQILCIESLLSKKEYEKLEGYVQNIHGNLNKELDLINTNHVIVNAILNTKYQEAVEKGIVFVLKINDLSNIKMKDEDIVTILSNLIDNAIEACEKCTDKKIIRLKFIKKDEGIIIAVNNTFNHTIHYENGEIKTTKLSKEEEHGVGIKNVIKVVEKYDGSYVIKEQDKEFLFSILISF